MKRRWITFLLAGLSAALLTRETALLAWASTGLTALSMAWLWAWLPPRRSRPAALAAILGMIPLARSIFWGPMAITIMGGLLSGILLSRPLSSMAAQWLGWRGVFVIAAVMTLLTVGIIAATLPRRVPQHRASYGALLASNCPTRSGANSVLLRLTLAWRYRLLSSTSAFLRQ